MSPATQGSGPFRPGRALPRWTPLAVAAGAILVALFALTATNTAGMASAWETAHWTWAAAIAAALGVYAVGRCSRYRSIAVWLAAGPVVTLAASIVYDVVVMTAAFSVPAAYDPLFLASYPMMVVGMFLAARQVLSRAEGTVFLIDAAIGIVTVAIVTVALFESTIGAVGGVAAFVVTAYPVVFMGTALAAGLAMLVLHRHSAGPGLVLIGIGSALVGIDWAWWLAAAVEGPPPPGSVPNYLWSVGTVMTGIGTVIWRFTPQPTTAADQLRLVRGLVPVGALLVALTVMIVESGPAHTLVKLLTVGAVILAMARQTLLLFERERFAAREASIAAEAERQRQAAEEALAAQRASEEHYRSTVDVFNRLGEQVSFAAREEDLLRAAVAAMARLAPSDRGELLLVNASQDRLVVGVAWGDEAPQVGAELEERPVRCLGIRRGSLYVVEDAADELTLTCPAHPATRGSVMCVPLMALGDTVGVAHLEREEPHAFDADGAREVSRVAEQVALAVANTRMLRSMESLALTDQLTRLHNARFFEPFLDRELTTAVRDDEPMAVIMIDLDHFKEFNDTYGHAAGDDALRSFARAVLGVARDSDTVARYGGEEFVVAARHADLAGGVALAERMRQAIERSPVELGPGRFAPFTASFGVASTEAHGTDRRALMKAADLALYQAKHNGRNRVEAAPDPGLGRIRRTPRTSRAPTDQAAG